MIPVSLTFIKYVKYQHTLIVTHQQTERHTYSCHDIPRITTKSQKVGSGPNPGNSHPFPQIAGILLPLIQFSCSVMSDSLQPHGLQHAGLPCPSPTPGVHPNSCPSSWWFHPAICCPLLLLPPIPPSIRVFSNESTLHIRWPKYWSFSFSISPSKEIPGLISFRMNWLDVLAVQGTLKSLLQHHSSKASILRREQV